MTIPTVLWWPAPTDCGWPPEPAGRLNRRKRISTRLGLIRSALVPDRSRRPDHRDDLCRLVGRDDTDDPVPAEMLPRHWGTTLHRREYDLDAQRRIRMLVFGECPSLSSDYDIHEHRDTNFWPPLDEFDFVAAVENAPSGLWPSEADDLFYELAEVYRGHVFRPFPHAVLNRVPDLVERVDRIVESDVTGRHFMRLDASQASAFWAQPRRYSGWAAIPPGVSLNADDANHMAGRAVQWATGFAFTRLRRQIRWEPFPLQECALCGYKMQHQVDMSINTADAASRWCGACTGPTAGFPSAAEAAAALSAYATATGVIPVNVRMIGHIPHDKPGPVRDVMRATITTLGGEHGLRQAGLWPWGRALVAAGIVEEFVKTKRGYQSEASDGYWCRSIFERQIDDYLTHHGIRHEHEPAWPAHPELNPRGAKRADWRLPDGTMVEAAGMLSDAGYAAQIELKRTLAFELDIPLLIITPEMVLSLDNVFARWLPEKPGRRPEDPVIHATGRGRLSW